MSNHSCAKIVLNIDKTKLNKDIEESKVSVLTAIAKINEELKLNPVNIQVYAKENYEQSKLFLRQMVSDALEDLGYTVDAIRSNTEHSSNKGYTNTSQTQSRNSSGSFATTSSDVIQSSKTALGRVVNVAVKGNQIYEAFNATLQNIIKTFNDFDNAINALASKTMSFADMLDLSQNNVSIGYFAQMINQSAVDIFHANNIGAGYGLKAPVSMRQLQMWGDINTQLAKDPQHVRHKNELDSLVQIDPRILQVKNEKGILYTALQRQNMVAEANSKLMQSSEEGKEQAAYNAKVFGHNNQNVAAMYMDYMRYKGYADQKADQKWINPVTGTTEFITRSEYQARTLGNSSKITDLHTKNQQDQLMGQNQGINDYHYQFGSNLQNTNKQIQTARQNGLFGKVAHQTYWNDQARMWTSLYQAKGSLAGWGGMGPILGTMFPKINPVTGERVYSSDDFDPMVVKAYQAGQSEAAITKGDQISGAKYGVMSFNAVNHKAGFEQSMKEKIISDKKDEIKQQRIEEAKKLGKSPITIQNQINDKALTKAVQEKAIQNEIKVKLDALMQIYEAGKQQEITNQGELAQLLAKTVFAASATYTVPQLGYITTPWILGEYAQHMALESENNISSAVLKQYADSKHQQTKNIQDFSLSRSPYNPEIFNKNGYPNNTRSPRVNMPENQYQKLLHEFTFTDNRKIDSIVNIYANTNDPHALGRIAQENLRSVVMKPAKPPLGFSNSGTEQDAKGIY